MTGIVRETTGIIAAGLVPWILGMAALLFLTRGRRFLSRAEYHILSFGLGCGLVTLLMFFQSLAGHSFDVRGITFWGILAAGVVFFGYAF